MCPFDRSRNAVRENSESGRTNHVLRDDTCFRKPFRRNRSQEGNTSELATAGVLVGALLP